jgi:hypothetical protein
MSRKNAPATNPSGPSVCPRTQAGRVQRGCRWRSRWPDPVGFPPEDVGPTHAETRFAQEGDFGDLRFDDRPLAAPQNQRLDFLLQRRGADEEREEEAGNQAAVDAVSTRAGKIGRQDPVAQELAVEPGRGEQYGIFFLREFRVVEQGEAQRLLVLFA